MGIMLDKLMNASYLETVFADFDGKVDAAFVKNLREKLSLTQYVFAKMLHVSKKTVEKWEQGGNPIKGGDAALLYLLDKHPEYAKDLLQIIPHHMLVPTQFAFFVDYSNSYAKCLELNSMPSSGESNMYMMDCKNDSWGVSANHA